jgi:hypothetical protein
MPVSGGQTATLANVASSATTVTIFAAANGSNGRTVFNDSTAVLYLAFAATASETAYTVQIPADGYYEVPWNYDGVISGIWASANGNARTTAW